MKVLVAGREVEVAPGVTLFALRDRLEPAADVVVLNGAPAGGDRELREGDAVVLIRRGEVPSEEEFEALMAARQAPEVRSKIRGAAVGVAGLGGLGSAAAVALARLGVGRLVLADLDVVEPGNLGRQQYFTDQLGMGKAEALAASLKRINPYVKLTAHQVRLTPENVPEIFGGVDVMVEALDGADQKAMLMESFAAAFPARPLVMASGLAGHGPGTDIGVRRLGRCIYVVGDLESAAGPGRGLMAPRVGIAAHMQANLVLRLLLGEEDP